MKKYSKAWWKEWAKKAGVRAIKTAAQTAASAVGVTSIAIHEVDWLIVASTAAGAAAISLIMSLAGLPEIETEE